MLNAEFLNQFRVENIFYIDSVLGRSVNSVLMKQALFLR